MQCWIILGVMAICGLLLRCNSKSKNKVEYKILIITIGAIIILPNLIEILMGYITADNGDDGDWLGFWGGYLGTIITVAGVYWQVRKQRDNDKEADFREARPLFLLTKHNDVVNLNDKGRIYAFDYTSLSELFNKSVSITYFCINNVSDKFMAGVMIKFYSKKESVNPDEIIKINKIPKDAEYRIIYKGNLKDDKNVDPEKVKVCFTTPIRERIVLTFLIEGSELKYQKTLSEIENKGGIKENYTLDDFQETKRYEIK